MRDRTTPPFDGDLKPKGLTPGFVPLRSRSTLSRELTRETHLDPRKVFRTKRGFGSRKGKE